MTNPIVNDPARRHDFVLLFDVTDGNPNGDPDAGNLPRVDPETMQGLVTDVAIKRKVRDYVDLARGSEQHFKIYVQHEAFLADNRARVFAERSGGKKTSPADGRAWMCDEFFDVRMFGAVMSMKENNAGQVRGPVQITFARSIDPIIPLDLSIVGPAQNAKEVRKDADEGEPATFGTMGRKSLVPYALYRAHGFFNPHFAKQTGVSEEDLTLLWRALQDTWDTDRSAARGLMACRGLYVFTHDSSLGNAPAHKLFELIQAPKSAVDAPREFADYTVTRPADGEVRPGVTLTTLAE
ncbi:MAG: type I-C CRISPR-associated protein Cas7/Csd2 [Chloroflexi bacterium]|nr:type I-C CRISPR-associated protein Cas7/Csd2 [Chloroflexota bacterium]